MKTYYQKLSKQDKEAYINRQKQWRLKHSDKIKMYRKKHAKKQKEFYEKWYKENGRNRASNYLEKILEWHQKYPKRIKIMGQLNRAVNSGKIKRPETCPKCGRKTRIHAHHFNYDHYTNFVWLCASCHKKEHEK